MKLGDLILIDGDGLIPDTIEKITSSKYSHVADLVKDNELIESQGFQKTSYQALDVYAGQDIYTCPTLSDEQRRIVVGFAISKIGTRYSYFLIFWELLRYTLNILLPVNIKKTYICSTLWVEAYRAAGIDLCPDVKYASPADIANSKLLVKVDSQL